MRAVVVRRAGGYDRLRVEERPDPAPGPGELRVRVRAIGVNYADCVTRMGLYASAREYVGWPITPGFEVSGEVDAGDDAPAGPVCAVTRFGGYATHVVVPRHQVFPVPRGWDPLQAAGFPTVYLTAWYALRRLAQARPGERLLVHSAAGGVGGALLQIARALGCEAVGVVGGAHKIEAARRQGAVEVVQKGEWRAKGPFDVVLDANGYATLRDSYAALAPCGRLVVYGFHSMLPRAGGRPSFARLAWGWLRTPRFDPLDMTTSNRSVHAFNLSFLFHRADVLREALAELLGWAERGLLAPPPTRTFPLDAVAEAHRALESGATVGKLVLLP